MLKPHAYLQPLNKISANFQNDRNKTVRGSGHSKYNFVSEMQKNELSSQVEK